MPIAWERILPVVISIVIIITVAILRDQSKTLAAIMATMPINITLALWIVTGAEADQNARALFSQGLLIGIFPTVLFLLVTWFVIRSGWPLLPTLIAGYAAWGLLMGVILFVRRGL
jgi:hypothetical protein